MAASTARACLRSGFVFVYSQRMSHAWSRFMALPRSIGLGFDTQLKLYAKGGRDSRAFPRAMIYLQPWAFLRQSGARRCLERVNWNAQVYLERSDQLRDGEHPGKALYGDAEQGYIVPPPAQRMWDASPAAALVSGAREGGRVGRSRARLRIRARRARGDDGRGLREAAAAEQTDGGALRVCPGN